MQIIYNLGVTYMALSKFDEAIECFEGILKNVPNNIDALINIGAIAIKQNNRDKAVDYYQRALEIDSENQTVQFILSALLGKQDQECSPDDYVKNLFDRYALFFDGHLTKGLDYRVPNELLFVVRENLNLENNKLSIFDLGCGTGLTGEKFKEFSSYLAGVDLSSKMIRLAKNKNIYDELMTETIDDALKKFNDKFDLILAGDVFVYSGDLSTVFQRVNNALKPKGLFVFTTEINEADGYVLQDTARFAHSKAYINDLARKHGFEILSAETIDTRKQENSWLQGYCFCMRTD